MVLAGRFAHKGKIKTLYKLLSLMLFIEASVGPAHLKYEAIGSGGPNVLPNLVP